MSTTRASVIEILSLIGRRAVSFIRKKRRPFSSMIRVSNRGPSRSRNEITSGAIMWLCMSIGRMLQPFCSADLRGCKRGGVLGGGCDDGPAQAVEGQSVVAHDL